MPPVGQAVPWTKTPAPLPRQQDASGDPDTQKKPSAADTSGSVPNCPPNVTPPSATKHSNPELVKISSAQSVPSPSPPPTQTASIPTMITRRMEADLRHHGFSQEQINRMTPSEAWELLRTVFSATTPPGHLSDASIPQPRIVPAPRTSKLKPAVSLPNSNAFTAMAPSLENPQTTKMPRSTPTCSTLLTQPISASLAPPHPNSPPS